MTNAKTIKLLFIEMEAAERECDRVEALYEQDLKYETEFDVAYRVSFNATEKLITELCKLGYDAKTWRRVLATKRDEVRNLCHRLAA